MPPKPSPFEKIARIDHVILAQVLETLLNERAIPYRMRSFHDTAYNGLFQLQKGWGEIYAPAEHREEILAMIENIEQGIEDDPDIAWDVDRDD